jgi:tRNA(fMet)-specific endonuclease VapC
VILDTNALSALADGDGALAEKIGGVATLAVPVVVLGEYRYGILGSRHRAAYEGWLHDHLQLFDVLPVEEASAEIYARLRHELKKLGRPIPENDLWIAALSRQHRLAVVSRDRHFAAVPGLQLVSW